MGLLKGLFSGGLKEVGGLAKDIRAAVVNDLPAEKRAEFEIKMAEFQAKINEIEAANPRLFVSGWRPAIGWICAAAIGYSFLLYPLLLSFGVQAAAVDMEGLWPLIIGMLGIGGLRTMEKTKGVQDKH
jgi:hypothetical protein